LSAPAIQWPAGIEGFEPVIKDSLDKTQAPLKGSRTFRFPFVAGKAGNYSIPAFAFTFFNPDSNNYKTVLAATPEINISNEEKKVTATETTKPPVKKKPGIMWWAGGGVLIILIMALLLFIKRRRKEIITESPSQEKAGLIRIEELLLPAQFALKADDSQFYHLLQKSIWDHLSSRLQLSGSKINKDDLYKAMKEKNLDEDQCRGIITILQECEAAVFTKAEFADGKQELLQKTRAALEQIKK
jgi:hypothetical protein